MRDDQPSRSARALLGIIDRLLRSRDGKLRQPAELTDEGYASYVRLKDELREAERAS